MDPVLDQGLSRLRDALGARVDFPEKRMGVFQIVAPIYHEDGDMVDVFVERSPDNGGIRISDHGMTLMRLSYDYDIDTPNKQKILDRMLAENGLQQEDGRLYVNVAPDSIYPGFLQFVQAVSKVAAMRYHGREAVRRLFYEMLEQLVEETLGDLRPEKGATPLSGQTEYVVDWRLDTGRHPVFLFGVKDNAKARLVAVTCLTFLRKELDFRSVVVHRDFDSLSGRDRKIITSAVDKQFPDPDDFAKNGHQTISRLAA